MSYVIDCSSVVDALRQPDSHALPESNYYAPALIDIEFAHTLRRLVRHQKVTLEAAHAFLDEWMDMDVFRSSHRLLLGRVWELRNNFTAYDAAYVALAESLQIPLVTADRRLARAAEQYCDVITVGD